MSNLTVNSKSDTASSTLDSASGKALSRARREAMSRGGKTALGQIKTSSSVMTTASSLPAISTVHKPVETITMPPVTEIASITETAGGLKNAEGKAESEHEEAIDELCSIVTEEPSSIVGQVASAVRKLCQERRRALSNQGKKAVKVMDMKVAANEKLTGRAAARARRVDLCKNGRGNDPVCRPSGRLRPDTTANKVEFGTTLSGTTVSGSQLERNNKITGVESGTCREITGTEYIGAEQYVALCSSTPFPPPAKVGVGMTSRGQRVSGIDRGRADKVTGTEVAANKAITGNEYLSTDKLESIITQPAPLKVGIMATRTGLGVSGTEVGRSVKVTGDEQGSCLAISGTEYTGSDQFESFCDATQQAASRALIISRGAHAGTGSRIDGGNKVTGAERGEHITLSGTPYSTKSQSEPQSVVNNNPHPLARGPANVPHVEMPEERSPVVAQRTFSIITPARSSQKSCVNKVSGTAYGAIGRITGPVNLAAGLVSGTPEFRYQDGPTPIMSSMNPTPIDSVSARNRLTGDGREGGVAITGAAWRRNESITGTEGAFSQRNQTMRGEPRKPMISATQFKERERPDLPVSKVTGSSGSDAKGSAITYSGGARG